MPQKYSVGLSSAYVLLSSVLCLCLQLTELIFTTADIRCWMNVNWESPLMSNDNKQCWNKYTECTQPMLMINISALYHCWILSLKHQSHSIAYCNWCSNPEKMYSSA